MRRACKIVVLEPEAGCVVFLQACNADKRACVSACFFGEWRARRRVAAARRQVAGLRLAMGARMQMQTCVHACRRGARNPGVEWRRAVSEAPGDSVTAASMTSSASILPHRRRSLCCLYMLLTTVHCHVTCVWRHAHCHHMLLQLHAHVDKRVLTRVRDCASCFFL